MKKAGIFASIFLLAIFVFSLINFPSVFALNLAVHVPEKYTDIRAGDRFYFEIEIKYPENPKRKDLKLEYQIKNQDGDVISQAKVLKAIETQASFIDFIVIPESAETGMHEVNVKVKDYESLSEEVSASFHIIGQKSDEMKFYFLVVLGFLVFVGMMIAGSIVLIKLKAK